MATIDTGHHEHCHCAGCGVETFGWWERAVFWLGYYCLLRWPRLAGAMLSAVKRWNGDRRWS